MIEKGETLLTLYHLNVRTLLINILCVSVELLYTDIGAVAEKSVLKLESIVAFNRSNFKQAMREKLA